MRYKNKNDELVSLLETIEARYGDDKFPRMIAGAYVLLLAKKNAMVEIEDLEQFLKKSEKDNSISLFLLDSLANHWNDYRRFLTTFDENTIRTVILELKDRSISKVSELSDSIYDLVAGILSIADGDKVADFGTGYGRFLCRASKLNSNASYWGDEIGTTMSAVAMIRGKVMGNFNVTQEDMFDSGIPETYKFDKAFCFPPLKMRIGNRSNVRSFLNTLPPSVPEIKSNVSSEWIFALKMLSCMKESGTCVLLMTTNSLFSQADNMIRKYFLEHRLIQAIIQLPSRLIDRTNIAPVLVVFRCKTISDWKVRLIDASNLGQSNRRNTVFSEDNVHEILTLFNGEKSNQSIMKDEDGRDLIVRGNLNPIYYVQEEIDISNKRRFGSIILSITRGAMISSDNLSQILTDEKTPYYYLSLKNINDGFIDEDLPHIARIEPGMERYRIPNHALLISKLGNPIKIAVASFRDANHIVIGSENIFIVKIDETIADPFYLKAFLESRKGMALLNRAAKGAIIPNLSRGSLEDMFISLPPLREQKRIAADYQEKMVEVAILKRRLEKAIESLKDVIEN